MSLLSGKPTPEKSCCGLSPAQSLLCRVTFHQALRVVFPEPRPAWVGLPRPTVPLHWDRTKAQSAALLWQSCQPSKASSTQALLGVLRGKLLKWKEEAVGKPFRREWLVCRSVKAIITERQFLQVYRAESLNRLDKG